MNDLERKEEELFVEAMIDLWIRNDAPEWIIDYVRQELRKQRGLLEGETEMTNQEAAVEPICKIIFHIPYYFCGRCNEMLNMYATKAMFCSKCGCPVKWATIKD